MCSLDRDAKWLAWFEQQFSMVAGEDRQIDMDEFKRALHVKKVKYCPSKHINTLFFNAHSHFSLNGSSDYLTRIVVVQ